MCCLTLPVRRKGGAEDISDTAVKIPFQIIHLSVVKYITHHVEDVIAHFPAGEVQYKLVTAPHRIFLRHFEHPVGMCPV